VPGGCAARSARVRTVAPSDDGSVVAGVGALLAAGGLFGLQAFDPVRFGSQPFLHFSSAWWGRAWAVNIVVVLLLALCGLALVARVGDWAAALMLAPAAMVGVLLTTSTGALSRIGVGQFAAGAWAAVIGALGCLVAVVMGTRQLALGSWASDGDDRARGSVTALVAVAGVLAVAGLFATRAHLGTGFFSIPLDSLFTNVHGGWNWFLALGTLFVTVAVTAIAVTLGNAPRAGWFVLGIAGAVLVWTGDSVSNVALRARGYQPAPGFWLIVIAAALFVVAGIVQIQGESV
jgi:hypothetical protein